MNVYYLPTRAQSATDTPVFPPVTTSTWSGLCARAHRAWWRLRVTAVEVCAVIRRGGARNPFEDHIWFSAPEPPAPRRRSAGPARVIDLDLVRQQRAPARG
jgi:hypothetical protein